MAINFMFHIVPTLCLELWCDTELWLQKNNENHESSE